MTRLLPPRHSSASRRALLQNLAPALAGLAGVLPASAFENRLPVDEVELKYKTPRTKGPKPTDLGPRAGGLLKPCTDGKPHCFSTSPVTFDDSDLYEAAKTKLLEGERQVATATRRCRLGHRLREGA